MNGFADELLAAVNRAFDVLGAETPGWPNPHPNGAAPLEEEYSRVTDVGKYRILDPRVDAWGEVLADAGLAEISEVPAETWIAAARPVTDHLRVRRIAPIRTGGLTLLFANTQVDGAPFGLDVGVARDGSDPVFVEPVPPCGCDACDHGSADLLDMVDDWVLTVARGDVAHARVRARVQRWIGTPWF